MITNLDLLLDVLSHWKVLSKQELYENWNNTLKDLNKECVSYTLFTQGIYTLERQGKLRIQSNNHTVYIIYLGH